MKDDDITCAYGFDKLNPAGKRMFKDFLRVLKTLNKNPLYPTFSKEKKDELFKRIWNELKCPKCGSMNTMTKQTDGGTKFVMCGDCGEGNSNVYKPNEKT